MFKQRSRAPLWPSGPLHCIHVLTVTVERTWVHVRLPACTLRHDICGPGLSSPAVGWARAPQTLRNLRRPSLQPSSWTFCLEESSGEAKVLSWQGMVFNPSNRLISLRKISKILILDLFSFFMVSVLTL